MLVIAFTTIETKGTGSVFDFYKQDTPISLNSYVVFTMWALVFVLQTLFVIFPLPIMNPGEHFKNILQLRVKRAFIFFCILQTCSILVFAIANKHQYLYSVALGFFATLKLVNHWFGYLKIKYRDDGRDYVSAKEFLAIHCTFSVLHAWISYCCYFCIFVFSKVFFNLIKINEVYDLEGYGQLVLFLLFIEQAIYLAYFKDVVFSASVILILYGI